MKKNKTIKIFSVIVSLLIVIFIFILNISDSYYLADINLNQIWKYSSGESQVIAFIDTGITSEYEEKLGNRCISKFNILKNNNDVEDGHGHGTQMVSLACGNGAFNVYGCAKKASIIIIKAVADNGKTDNEALYDALVYAEKNGATVINASIGGFQISDKVISQIKKLNKKNITVVAAAGDYANKDLLFPASAPTVISVEARDNKNSLWEDSNTSETSVLRFPGVKVNAVSLVDEETKSSDITGTSVSTAIASGYIACIKDYYAKKQLELTNKQLKKILKQLNSTSEQEILYKQPFEAQQ